MRKIPIYLIMLLGLVSFPTGQLIAPMLYLYLMSCALKEYKANRSFAGLAGNVQIGESIWLVSGLIGIWVLPVINTFIFSNVLAVLLLILISFGLWVYFVAVISSVDHDLVTALKEYQSQSNPHEKMKINTNINENMTSIKASSYDRGIDPNMSHDKQSHQPKPRNNNSNNKKEIISSTKLLIKKFLDPKWCGKHLIAPVRYDDVSKLLYVYYAEGNDEAYLRSEIKKMLDDPEITLILEEKTRSVVLERLDPSASLYRSDTRSGPVNTAAACSDSMKDAEVERNAITNKSTTSNKLKRTNKPKRANKPKSAAPPDFIKSALEISLAKDYILPIIKLNHELIPATTHSAEESILLSHGIMMHIGMCTSLYISAIHDGNFGGMPKVDRIKLLILYNNFIRITESLDEAVSSNAYNGFLDITDISKVTEISTTFQEEFNKLIGQMAANSDTNKIASLIATIIHYGHKVDVDRDTDYAKLYLGFTLRFLDLLIHIDGVATSTEKNFYHQCESQLNELYSNLFADDENVESDEIVTDTSIGDTYNSAQTASSSTSHDHGSVETSVSDATTVDLNSRLESTLKELDSLIGLQNIKADVRSMINFLRVQHARTMKGLPAVNISNHMVFYGNPGTGKTTIARLLAEIYNKMGLLSKGHLVETDRSGLVAGYVGQTAIKTRKVLDSALGGILFIDEAYSLSGKDNNDQFGLEAIDTILKFMEDNRDQIIVIVAGYEPNMKDFLGANPGLESRFNKYLYFKDYTYYELAEIFILMTHKNGYTVDAELGKCIEKCCKHIIATKSDNFANARTIRNLLEKSMLNHANRLSQLIDVDRESLSKLEVEDIRLDDIATSSQLI